LRRRHARFRQPPAARRQPAARYRYQPQPLLLFLEATSRKSHIAGRLQAAR
jgi:hypothetical protein